MRPVYVFGSSCSDKIKDSDKVEGLIGNDNVVLDFGLMSFLLLSSFIGKAIES